MLCTGNVKEQDAVCVCDRDSWLPSAVPTVPPGELKLSVHTTRRPLACVTRAHPEGHDEPLKYVANPLGSASTLATQQARPM